MVLATPRIVRNGPYICSSCARLQHLFKTRIYHITRQRRSISQKFIEKTAIAADQWAMRGKEIKAGTRQSILSMLEERGYVNQIAGERDELDSLINKKRVGAYVGIDATAPSMHVGHLLPLMSLFWMFINGCHAITLLGGATAQIGDPTGRTTLREPMRRSVRQANMANLHVQLKKIWQNVETYARKYGYFWEWAWHRELSNNSTWLNKVEIMEVLKVFGPGIRIGTMLGRDTVRKRMESGDGMSLAEFLYPILQAQDWWTMYQRNNIQIQIGGSDQFGNIVTGIEAIKYAMKNHYDPDIRQEKENYLNNPMGFSVPLLTAGSGEKFGKSAGNAVWLDSDMTSTFDLYQFYLRTADADVRRYLTLFTFMPISMIDSIMREHESQPSKRIAQHKLAFDVLELVHGATLAKEAENQHQLIFNPSSVLKLAEENSHKPGDINPQLNPLATPTTALNAPSPHLILPKSLIYKQPFSRVLYAAGLVSSRSEGHRLVSKGGAYVGSRPEGVGSMRNQLEFAPIQNWVADDTEKFVIDGDLIILRVGKWKVKIVKIISDEEFEEQGLTAPGWKEDVKPGDDSDEDPKPPPRVSFKIRGIRGGSFDEDPKPPPFRIRGVSSDKRSVDSDEDPKPPPFRIRGFSSDNGGVDSNEDSKPPPFRIRGISADNRVSRVTIKYPAQRCLSFVGR